MSEFHPRLMAIQLVRDHYPRQFWSEECHFLGGAGGFSGARLWRLVTQQSDYCLRRWPSTHPNRERLQWIHSILQWAEREGFGRLPTLQSSNRGETFFWADGHFWELTSWVSGRADFHDDPSEQKLAAAMSTLAEFHHAVATHASASERPALSPGLEQRLQQLSALTAGGLESLQVAVYGQVAPPFDTPAKLLMNWLPDGARQATRIARSTKLAPVALQPAIRDIWHDHVFFQGGQVTGLVDFGSMRIESVCGDIARLLGSLVRSDQRLWASGLVAYETIRPLTATERDLIPLFDVTSIVLSAVNWLNWLYVERRAFDDSAAVLRRLQEAETRLESLVERNGLGSR